jgi:hypothetical protein
MFVLQVGSHPMLLVDSRQMQSLKPPRSPGELRMRGLNFVVLKNDFPKLLYKNRPCLPFPQDFKIHSTIAQQEI